MSAPVDVRAVLDVAASWLPNDCEDNRIRERFAEARAAVAELIEADKEHDAAIQAAKDLNRKVAERGWFEVEFDALRKISERVVRAQMRRARAIAKVGGQP